MRGKDRKTEDFGWRSRRGRVEEEVDALAVKARDRGER